MPSAKCHNDTSLEGHNFNDISNSDILFLPYKRGQFYCFLKDELIRYYTSNPTDRRHIYTGDELTIEEMRKIRNYTKDQTLFRLNVPLHGRARFSDSETPPNTPPAPPHILSRRYADEDD